MTLVDYPYHWLDPGYRPPPCKKCGGRSRTCQSCGGSGRGAPILSRTHAIRRAQEAAGQNACYGVLGKARRGRNGDITPSNCGSDDCPYRRSCVGLHLGSRYHSERIREDSIEYLSRLILSARAVEQRSQHLTAFQSEVAELIQQWTDDTPQVAVLGAFSAGKSTLLNRLLGKSILPATRTPTTAVVTSIRYDDQAHGMLHFRTMARVILVSQDARSPDPAAIQALRAWLRDPASSGVRRIDEVDAKGGARPVDRQKLLLQLEELPGGNDTTAMVHAAPRPDGVRAKLRRAIGRRAATPVRSLTRTFEVQFKKRLPQAIELTSDEGIAAFGRYLTEPHLALALNRATCYLPDRRLQSLNFLDTAGLCSPVGFHKDVTTELLKRRPDKMLVLLDARRLDCPTNGEALKVLGRFVSVPDDYRQVTFALTFWDLALRTHMLEDSEPELDFDSPDVRAAASRRFAQSKRDELVRLLPSWVGVRCESEPVIFTLGLGPQAPSEMHKTREALWRHLEEDCRGWVGVEMWAERWRAARGLADRLVELHAETFAKVEKTWREASDDTDLDAEMARLKAQSKQVGSAVMRAENSLREVVHAQRNRMLAEISAMDSKSGILKYLEGGYCRSANTALAAVQEESQRQNKDLCDLYRGARALDVIALDRKLLGIDDSARLRARAEVSGVLYGLKSIWDFLFKGVAELNEGNRDAAREILRSQARDTVDIISGAVDRWATTSHLICNQAMAEYAERVESLANRKDDALRYVEGLQRRLRFLGKCQTPISDLSASVKTFADGLEAARFRVAASRQSDFSAVLYTEDGQLKLKKGREQDLLLLFDMGPSSWTRLEVWSDGSSTQFVPVSRGQRYVGFVEADGSDHFEHEPVRVPDGAVRFELRLSTLEGEFRFKNRRIQTKYPKS